jgi:hypothetical protein
MLLKPQSNFDSRFACWTWASLWLLSVMLCVAWPPPFFVPPAPVVGGGAGVIVVCDIDSLVSSDWKPGNTNVVIPFKVKLEISNFQRVATAVFGQAAGKVRDRVDKLVRNVEQQLGEHRVNQRSWVGSQKRVVRGLTSSTSGSIFTLGSMLDTKSWMDLRML